MILHIFNKQIKFSVKYFEFLIDYNENLCRHKLFHYGKKNKFFNNLTDLDSKFCNSFYNPIPHIWLYKQMKQADEIIIHSLASPYLIIMLLLNKKMRRKAYWVIWGKDLYIHRKAKKINIPYRIYDLIRKPVIRDIGYIITSDDGDYNLAVQWYGATAIREEMTKLAYPYSVDVIGGETDENKPYMNILLGNSGSKTNRHLNALEILDKADDGKMHIISPLSYGGSRFYIKKVIKKGKKLFGERFHPVTQFMAYNDYMNMLNSIDIAFFFHDRQEAMNNTISLIAKKKTVYIRNDVTSWNYITDKGITVLNSLDISGKISALPQKILDRNVQNLKNIWDPEFSYKQWKQIFDKEST